MYQLSGVVKQYKTKRGTINALDGLDLTVSEGDLLVIQGPTGGGKSTLLQMLGGLDRPTKGSVQFDGNEFGKINETELTQVRATSIGLVFQFFNLIPTLNAQENVEAALVPLGIEPSSRRDRAKQALESVNLGDRLHHLPTELSGGQQQRVAIARALVKEPKVILADEPTGNLDEDTRDEIIGLFEGLWKDRGLTVVMVTHDSAIARWAPRVASIKKGRLTMKKESSVDV